MIYSKIAKHNYLAKSLSLRIMMLICTLVLTMVLVACGSSNDNCALSGIWQVIHGRTNAPALQIEFSNGNFTTVTPVDRFGGSPYTPPWRVSREAHREEFLGGWRVTQHGTYSITDNRVELLFSDGTIEVLEFTHTENTLTLRHSSWGTTQSFVRAHEHWE